MKLLLSNLLIIVLSGFLHLNNWLFLIKPVGLEKDDFFNKVKVRVDRRIKKRLN